MQTFTRTELSAYLNEYAAYARCAYHTTFETNIGTYEGIYEPDGYSSDGNHICYYQVALPINNENFILVKFSIANNHPRHFDTVIEECIRNFQETGLNLVSHFK